MVAEQSVGILYITYDSTRPAKRTVEMKRPIAVSTLSVWFFAVYMRSVVVVVDLWLIILF